MRSTCREDAIGPIPAALALWGCLLGGCDGAPGPDYAPTLAELSGTIVSSQAAAGSPRAAVVWRAVSVDVLKLLGHAFDDPVDGAAYQVRAGSADVPVAASFPSAFRVRIRELPPAEALLELGSSKLAMSFGALVFYDDVDGDARLDLERAGAPGADRILGAAEPLLVYVENLDRTLPTGSPDPTGFHLTHLPPLLPPPPCGQPARPFVPMPLLPLDQPLDVTLDGRPLPSGLCVPPDKPSLDCQPQPGDTVACNSDGSGWLVIAPSNGARCAVRAPCTASMCPAPAKRPDFCGP